jgi:hypothetical protein
MTTDETVMIMSYYVTNCLSLRIAIASIQQNYGGLRSGEKVLARNGSVA